MEPMTLALLAAGGGALLGGLGGASSNKSRAKPVTLPKYSGYTPPHVSEKYFRPIESMISETLMRRSQGQDVGFDPKRREELGKIYDIDFKRQQDESQADILNQLGGTGQSRNLAARDALLGQQKRWADDTRSKYMMGLDVEDLTRRADDVRAYTGALQDQNRLNFTQENQVADFGLRQYAAENNAMISNYAMEDSYAKQYQNPWATALSGAASGMGIGANVASMGAGMGSSGFQEKAGASGTYGSDIGLSGGLKGKRQDYFNKAPARRLNA